jgi:hypothetical protein
LYLLTIPDQSWIIPPNIPSLATWVRKEAYELKHRRYFMAFR